MSKRKQKADVSIVIPVFGMFGYLDKCIKSIPEACGDVDYELILFDNNSPDRDEAEKYYKSIEGMENLTIARSNENIGFPMACNKGASRGKASLVFFLNSDVTLLPNSVKSMVDKFQDPEIGVVGMKLLFPEESIEENKPPGTIQHVGLALDIRGMFQHIFVGWSKDNPRVSKVCEVSAVTGAAMMVRKKFWLRNSGFFEGYGLGTYEDVDLCYAAAEAGYKVIVDIEAVGYHFTNATASHYRIPYPLKENRQTFLQRWGKTLTYDEWEVL
jgi:GT2 family glycosyltransferase